jgi:hypothetical protein
MTRAELERLDRDALIARAESAGVARARILTRPELVDELLLRSTPDAADRRRARGLFGVARDLLARVVERGLNLPDAAETIRTLGTPPPLSRRSAPAALPTVTLAEIYAAQGHRERAIDTLAGVLAREPDHAAARTLIAQLRDASFHVPPPRMPPEDDELLDGATAAALDDGDAVGGDALDADDDTAANAVTAPRPPPLAPPSAAPAEPSHMLDDAPLPLRYDVDECVAIPVDPRTLYVYWEVRDTTLDELRRAHPQGTVTLRVVVIVPTWDGPQSSMQDHEVRVTLGETFLRDLPPGCVARVAIGWKRAGTFQPLAHSPALETPPGGPSPLVADALLRWTSHGPVPVHAADADAVPIQHALGAFRRDETLTRLAAAHGGFLGSSERWARRVDRVGH